jgi:uncharacterized protein (TIGR03086 family)
MIDLNAAVAELQRTAGGVTDAQLDASTPCAGRTIRGLLGHIIGLSMAFRAAADKELGPLTDTDPGSDGWPDAGDDWREELAARLPELASAWAEPDAWQGMTRAGGLDLPGDVAGLVALDEIVLHGWDLARATGQEYHCDETVARVLLDFVEGFDPGGTPGLFGAAVDAPDGASLFEQVLARSGRDPHWSNDSV